jgi:hypothetical protein
VDESVPPKETEPKETIEPSAIKGRTDLFPVLPLDHPFYKRGWIIGGDYPGRKRPEHDSEYETRRKIHF